MSASENATIWIRLSGDRQVAAGLTADAAAVSRLGRASKEAGIQAEIAGVKQWFHNQALFTLRRLAYAGTLAVLALGSAAVIMGFKFNASMESNKLAMTQFLGSEKLASRELEYLFDIAKYTPFEFSNVTDAARRFLAFGYTLQETNKYLNVIGDTVAAFGGGAENIMRMVLVFGQIKASGRLLGQDMLQLQQQGIPTIKILQEQLHLSGKALARIGDLSIPASVGIPALMRGMNQLFGGAARKQAQTFTGQISTLHDNISQLFGGMTQNLFNTARTGLLPSLNRTLNEISDRIRKQKGKISLAQAMGIFEKDFPSLHPVFVVINLLMSLGRGLAAFFTNVLWPSLRNAALLVGIVVIPAFYLLSFALQMTAKFSWAIVPVLTLLISLWAYTKLALIAVGIRTGIINGLLLVQHIRLMAATAWQARLNWAQMSGVASSLKLSGAQRVQLYTVGLLSRAYQRLQTVYGIIFGKNLLVRNAKGQITALTGLNLLALNMRKAFIGAGGGVRGLTAALGVLRIATIQFLLLNPFSWVIIAAAAFVLLYWKVRWFRDMINTAADTFKDRLGRMQHNIGAIWSAFRAVGDAIQVVINKMLRLWGIGQKVGNFFKNLWNRVPGHQVAGKAFTSQFVGELAGTGLFHAVFGPLAPIGAYAGGGTVHESGRYLVGERGPEVVTLPKGAEVSPNLSLGEIVIPVTLEVDGRKLANIMARYRLDTAARA